MSLTRLLDNPPRLTSAEVPASPNVTAVNQYGSYNLSSSRLAFIDGSEDRAFRDSHSAVPSPGLTLSLSPSRCGSLALRDPSLSSCSTPRASPRHARQTVQAHPGRGTPLGPERLGRLEARERTRGDPESAPRGDRVCAELVVGVERKSEVEMGGRGEGQAEAGRLAANLVWETARIFHL